MSPDGYLAGLARLLESLTALAGRVLREPLTP